MKKKLLVFATLPIALCLLCFSIIYWIAYISERQEEHLRETLQAPPHITPNDLTGVWIHHTSEGEELLILEKDFTFRQIFIGRKASFDLRGRWWIEHVGQGGFRLHLEGARFYSEGIEFALREGMLPAGGGLPERPYPFTDPFTGEGVEMPHKLVLQIRIKPSGEIVLHSMWTPGEVRRLGDMYHKIQTP